MRAAHVPEGTKTLQCPKCGLMLFEGHFTFPRCHRCQTLVQVCRYCVSYDSPSAQCIEPTSAVDNVIDPDALTSCPFFKQAPVVIEEEPPLFRRGFWLYAGIGAVVVVAIVAVLQYFVLAPLRRPAEGLDARVALPDTLTASRPWPIEITIYNQEADKELGFAVEFPAGTLRRFDVIGSTPPAVSKEAHRGGQRLTFEAVPPMQYTRVTVRVQPKRPGRKDFEMLVTDEHGRLIRRCAGRKLEIEP